MASSASPQEHLCDLTAPNACQSAFEDGGLQETFFSAWQMVMCFTFELEASISRSSHHDARIVALAGKMGPPFANGWSPLTSPNLLSGNPLACLGQPMPRLQLRTAAQAWRSWSVQTPPSKIKACFTVSRYCSADRYFASLKAPSLPVGQ